ncbi:conserved hypothetical protein [Streptomyces sp. Mg1]|nr:conserved hypothetical protein [Streptomyces sp. Mg1]
MTTPGSKTAVDWLVSAAPDPDACRWEWERNPLGVALLPAGRHWDVLILPGALGRPTLDIVTRLKGPPGPGARRLGDARAGLFRSCRIRLPTVSARVIIWSFFF